MLDANQLLEVVRVVVPAVALNILEPCFPAPFIIIFRVPVLVSASLSALLATVTVVLPALTLAVVLISLHVLYTSKSTRRVPSKYILASPFTSPSISPSERAS